MNFAKRICLPLFSGLLCLTTVSCAVNIPTPEQQSWKQFAAAVDASPQIASEQGLSFVWQIPNKRLLMLARTSDEQALLYQIDHKAGLTPDDNPSQFKCFFEDEQLYCVGPAESSVSLVAASDADIFKALQAHAGKQISKLTALTQTSLQTQFSNAQPKAGLDLSRQRHPFEWGGEYETVENAQAFLNAVIGQGVFFRSSWPQAPSLGSDGNSWQNQNDVVSFKTMGRCETLAQSASRTAIHLNHDFWAADTVQFEAVYRWQQPIDWRRLGGAEITDDGVFFHGKYAGAFNGQALTYISGWSPSLITTNASRFNPSDYSVAAWNIRLLLPNSNGLRERVLYAVTYLNIMCQHGAETSAKASLN